MLDLLKFMQQDGYLSNQELIALRKTSKELGESPVRLLRSLNIASPEQIQVFLQKHFHVLILKEDSLANVGPEYQIYVPIDIALFYSCFGIGEEEDILYIAMEDPSDRGIVNQLRFLLGKRIVGVCATVYQLAEGLTKIYHFQVSNLKLTTAIERSRGVIGGIRYEEKPKETLEINDSFSGVGLEDEGKVEAPPQPPEAPKAAPPPEPVQEHPTFDFIDGSSGDVDPKLLEEEKKAETASDGLLDDGEDELGGESENTSSLETAENQLKEDSISVDTSLLQKISATVNIALTKIILIRTKEKALETLNVLFQPHGITIENSADDPLKLYVKGADFQVESMWNKLNNNKHPIYKIIVPVLKIVSKLN